MIIVHEHALVTDLERLLPQVFARGQVLLEDMIFVSLNGLHILIPALLV